MILGRRCLFFKFHRAMTNSYKAERSIGRKVFYSKLNIMPLFFILFLFCVHSYTILFLSTPHLQQSFFYRCFSPYSAFLCLIVLFFHITFFLDSFSFCFAIFFISMHFSFANSFSAFQLHFDFRNFYIKLL